MNEIINRLVENAIQKYGLEHKKTMAIVKNAENLKEKYELGILKIC